MKKLLILHGWYHSKERYAPLAQALRGVCCTLVDLPGFGENQQPLPLGEVEAQQVAYVRKILCEGHYDAVLAHSWGARILLQSIEDPTTLLLLLNPVYGTNRRLRVLRPLLPHLPRILSIPYALPIRLASLMTVNAWSKLDAQIVADVRRANHTVAGEILCTMVQSSYRCHRANPMVLIYSDRDRAIHPSCFAQLITDCAPTVHCFHGAGHTLVLERFPELCALLEQYL